MDLNERIEALCQHIDKLCIDYYHQNGYIHVQPPTHKANFISDKWCRVVTIEDRNGIPTESSVYCFVCLQDSISNKTLGPVQAGDIHKSASWKAPAKHARGSVFKEDFGRCCKPYGIVYLK